MSPFYTVWLLAQTAEPSPVAWFTQLGAFAVAAVIGWAWLRDISKARDRMLAAIEQQGPILAEIRDVMRTSADTLRAAGDAMAAMSEALRTRTPDQAELVRIRDLLANLESRLRQ